MSAIMSGFQLKKKSSKICNAYRSFSLLRVLATAVEAAKKPQCLEKQNVYTNCINRCFGNRRTYY